MVSHGVARLSWEQAKLMHYSSGAEKMSRRQQDDDLSVTDPSSISLAFLGHYEVVVAKAGVTSTRRIMPGNIMLCGAEPIRWLGGTGSGSSDYIEITADARFRGELADELNVPAHVHLDDLHSWSDPVVWGIAARFRSAARQAIFLDDLERDLLLRRLYARILETRFGGRDASRGHGGRLDAVRLNRVVEFIEAHLEEHLTIARLAEVAALSPFHFVRSFGKTFGLTPHRYVRARRFEMARDLLASGLKARTVALRVGYESFSHFRAAYRAHFGMTYEQDASLNDRGKHAGQPAD
jgi:AraC family transcriptional regulator